MANLEVKVVPGSSRNRIAGHYGDALKIQVSAAAERGKANQAVIEVLADALLVKPREIELIRGHAQPRKIFRIASLSQQELDARVANL